MAGEWIPSLQASGHLRITRCQRAWRHKRIHGRYSADPKAPWRKLSEGRLPLVFSCNWRARMHSLARTIYCWNVIPSLGVFYDISLYEHRLAQRTLLYFSGRCFHVHGQPAMPQGYHPIEHDFLIRIIFEYVLILFEESQFSPCSLFSQLLRIFFLTDFLKDLGQSILGSGNAFRIPYHPLPS